MSIKNRLVYNIKLVKTSDFSEISPKKARFAYFIAKLNNALTIVLKRSAFRRSVCAIDNEHRNDRYNAHKPKEDFRDVRTVS